MKTEWKSFDNDWPDEKSAIYVSQSDKEPLLCVRSGNAFYHSLLMKEGEQLDPEGSIKIELGATWCYYDNYTPMQSTKPPSGLPPLIFLLEQRQAEIIDYIVRCTEEQTKLTDKTVMELQWIIRAQNEIHELGIGVKE